MTRALAPRWEDPEGNPRGGWDRKPVHGFARLLAFLASVPLFLPSLPNAGRMLGSARLLAAEAATHRRAPAPAVHAHLTYLGPVPPLPVARVPAANLLAATFPRRRSPLLCPQVVGVSLVPPCAAGGPRISRWCRNSDFSISSSSAASAGSNSGRDQVPRVGGNQVPRRARRGPRRRPSRAEITRAPFRGLPRSGTGISRPTLAGQVRSRLAASQPGCKIPPGPRSPPRAPSATSLLWAVP